MLLLRAARDAIQLQRPTVLSRALAFLHRDLEPRCYLWEVAEIFKKLFLVGFAVLVQPGKTLQLVLGFLFCLVCMPLWASNARLAD